MDKEAGGDRLMRIRMHAIRQLEIINGYAPVARALYATDEENDGAKDAYYDKLKEWTRESIGSRIKLTAGDFNSRVQTQYEGEERHIGKYVFSPGKVDIDTRDETVLDNRLWFWWLRPQGTLGRGETARAYCLHQWALCRAG